MNWYERDRNARDACIQYYGPRCKVCALDFEERYGEIGKGFIHVHHTVPLSELGEKYTVDPIADLVPVCPSCNATSTKSTFFCFRTVVDFGGEGMNLPHPESISLALCSPRCLF